MRDPRASVFCTTKGIGEKQDSGKDSSHPFGAAVDLSEIKWFVFGVDYQLERDFPPGRPAARGSRPSRGTEGWAR
jgi:hypothetical protein